MEQQIDFFEKLNTGTSPTNCREFDENGYMVLRSLVDVTALCEVAPSQRGQIHYDKSGQILQTLEQETQVPGSLSRYNYPAYKECHDEIKQKIEEAIQSQLYPTYFYDRFYFYGQHLDKHTDRDACEISLTLFISSNPAEYQWPICIKSAKGTTAEVVLQPGDGLLYKGCERPHWREAFLPCTSWQKVLGKHNQAYFHQVFFHYVLANGSRAHFAFDKCKG